MITGGHRFRAMINLVKQITARRGTGIRRMLIVNTACIVHLTGVSILRSFATYRMMVAAFPDSTGLAGSPSSICRPVPDKEAESEQAGYLLPPLARPGLGVGGVPFLISCF